MEDKAFPYISCLFNYFAPPPPSLALRTLMPQIPQGAQTMTHPFNPII